ncbi:MAG: hypothetical protein Q7S14_02900 [bacterium]|nr:hypothetical protein [bacterium]
MDLTQTQLVSITDFRRNAGAYIRLAKPLRIIKDSQEIGTYTPTFPANNLTIEEKLKRLDQLAGGFNLGNFSPAKLNKILETSYD